MMHPRQLLSLTLALAWMGTIFFLSHQPSLPTPALFPGQDKLFHAGAYGLLGLLLYGGMPPRWGRRLLAAWLLATLYGGSDELHQLFVPGRSAEVLDWMADGVGALLGAALARRVGLKPDLQGCG